MALHDGRQTTCFPSGMLEKGAHSVSALTVDGKGNFLLATWPDQIVYLMTPDGRELLHWHLPVAVIWIWPSLPPGKFYAACDGGVLYELSDDEKTPIHVACRVPDLQIVTTTTDTQGNLYLATSPRGRIYRLSAEEHLTSIYEATEKALTAVTSLAVDQAGIVYAAAFSRLPRAAHCA